MKLRNYLKSLLVLCFLPMLFIYVSTANAAPLGCSWKIVSSPNPGSPDGLHSVATVSASDAWAVGGSGLQSGSGQPIIEQWNGTQWSAVSSPSTGTLYSTLTSVAVVSANDVWAVGWEGVNGVAETLTEHWNGTKWSIVSSPNPTKVGNELYSVAAVSTNDVWAVGFSENTTTIGPIQPTLVEQWNGTQWSVVSSPSPGSQINYLDSVAAVSANDVWAVGYADSQSLTEHWNGTQWSVVASSGPGPVSNSLLGVAVVSTSNVWAVGYYQTSDFVGHTLTEHWNGTKWSVVKSPSPGMNSTQFEGVAATSPTDVWAVGHVDSGTLIEHYC